MFVCPKSKLNTKMNELEMASHISRPAYRTDVFHSLNKFWTDVLQISAKDGGCHSKNPPPPDHPNVHPCHLRRPFVNHVCFSSLFWERDRNFFTCKNSEYFSNNNNERIEWRATKNVVLSVM